jgi:hypothetical protein
MLKIKDPAQRRALADLMEELTDFAALVSRVVVMEVELSSMLDPLANLPSPFSAVPLIGRGVRHTTGLQSGLKVMGPSGDETDRVRERIGEEAFNHPSAVTSKPANGGHPKTGQWKTRLGHHLLYPAQPRSGKEFQG